MRYCNCARCRATHTIWLGVAVLVVIFLLGMVLEGCG